MMTMRKLLLLIILATFCSNCQTQPGVLSLSGGAIAPVGNNPGIDRTTSSSEPTSGSEATPSPRAPISGTVVDAQSQKPILAATVFHNGSPELLSLLLNDSKCRHKFNGLYTSLFPGQLERTE